MNPNATIRFGPYRLDPAQRALLRGAEPVALTPRAFDLLMVLVENAGRVVLKDEILEKVWGRTVVEEGTLAWQVHALRQALAAGDAAGRYIETVPKRGYRFVAPLIAEPVDAPAPEPGPAPARRGRRRFLGAALAGSVLLVALLLWWNDRETTLPYDRRDWLLITDFENQTGDARFDKSLLTAMIVSVEQSRFVNVFPRSRIATALARMQKPAETTIDERVGREICVREGLRALLTPAITRAGRRYAITARLIDPVSGNAVRSYLVSADDENEVLAVLQDLAADLRQDLGESLADVTASNKPLDQVTTPVLVALQQYSEGQAAWRRGAYDDAVSRFEAAIAADPQFAMAHAALGNARYSMIFNRPDLGSEYFQRALAFAHRTTDRERQLIAAEFAARRGQTDDALRRYAAYSLAYPEDFDVQLRRGTLLMEAGRFAEAIPALEAARAIDPRAWQPQVSLAVALANESQFKRALAEYRQALQLDPALLDRSVYGNNYGFILDAAGQRQEATRLFLAAARHPTEGHRALRALGLIEQSAGRYRAAEAYLRAAIDARVESSDANLIRSRNHGYLGRLLQARGDPRAAIAEYGRASVMLDAHGRAPIEFRARLAIAYARLGDVAAADALLARAAGDADRGSARDASLIRQIRGEILSARGRSAEALREVEAANGQRSGIDAPLMLESLALAAVAAGQPDRAIEAYRELVAMPGRCLGWEAQQVCLLAQYELARLLQARGEETEARRVLAPLLRRWADADPEAPAVRELRRLDATLGKRPPATAAARLGANGSARLPPPNNDQEGSRWPR